MFCETDNTLQNTPHIHIEYESIPYNIVMDLNIVV